MVQQKPQASSESSAAAPSHVLVVNYAGIDLTRLPTALDRLSHCMEG